MIVDASVNAPGSYHDSETAMGGSLYRHIKNLPEPYRVCSDSAFYSRGALRGKIVKTLNARALDDDEYDESDGDLPPPTRQLVELRQPSEWGNAMLENVFRVLQ